MIEGRRVRAGLLWPTPYAFIPKPRTTETNSMEISVSREANSF
jgi:hypothetical protein